MTGDVNLTHIRSAINDACRDCSLCDDPDYDGVRYICKQHLPALAQLSAAEAVIQAARAFLATAVPKEHTDDPHSTHSGGEWQAFVSAVAALEDGQ